MRFIARKMKYWETEALVVVSKCFIIYNQPIIVTLCFTSTFFFHQFFFSCIKIRWALTSTLASSPQGNKTLFMLNSTGHEISIAQKDLNAKKLKGTATLVITTIYMKALDKTWILILVLSKSVEKCGSCGRLNIFKWTAYCRLSDVTQPN